MKFNEFMKKNKVLLLSLVGIIITIAVGVSFAYFSANIEPETTSSIVIGGAEMSIRFSDSNADINLTNIFPKAEAVATKTFTLTGTDTADFDMGYQMALVVNSNSFSSDTIKYTLTSENTDDSGVIVPSITEQTGIENGVHTIILGEGKFIKDTRGKTHTYTMNFYMPITNENQNEEQGKVMTAHIKIDPYNATRDGVKLAMQTVAKDGLRTAVNNAPVTGNYYMKNVCNGATASWDNNTKEFNVAATDVLAYCSVEFKELYNITPKNIVGYTFNSLNPTEVGYDDSVTFNFTPNAHYSYKSAECSGTHGNITNTANSITIANVKSDMECTINMELEKENITVSSPSNYTLGTYTQSVDYNGTATINFTPTAGYAFNYATCTGTHGTITNTCNTITIANVTSDTTCTIRMKSMIMTDVVRNQVGVTAGSGTVESKYHSYDNVQLASNTDYRYTGSNPNNYVRFNNELWRIIGSVLTEDSSGNLAYRIKLIRSETLGEYSYFTSASNVNSGYGIAEWSQGDLMKLFNPGYDSNRDVNSSGSTITVNNSLYWNRSSGTCYTNYSNATSSCNFTSTGLTSTAKTFIDTVKYYTGSIIMDTVADVHYNAQRGDTLLASPADGVTRQMYWMGKVGIMELADYGYAASTSTCNVSNIRIAEYNKTTGCTADNWLFNGQYQITISTSSSPSAYFIRAIASDGGAVITGAGVNFTSRPVVFLNKNTYITSGTGTSSDPYQISL